jgi:hypothetical protein
MSTYDIILIGLLMYSAVFLLTLGWGGIISDTPVLHRCPYTFHRPTIYLFVFGLLLLDEFILHFGDIVALIAFIIIAIDILYETIHPFISQSVEIECATPDLIQSDLIDAFQKLNLRYEGQFPKFRFPDEGAQLRVKYWPKLARAMLIIYPKKKMDLLLKISEIIEGDFDAAEGQADVRGYIGDVFVGFALLIFAIWQLVYKAS